MFHIEHNDTSNFTSFISNRLSNLQGSQNTITTVRLTYNQLIKERSTMKTSLPLIPSVDLDYEAFKSTDNGVERGTYSQTGMLSLYSL
jgi:hypothetical protein